MKKNILKELNDKMLNARLITTTQNKMREYNGHRSWNAWNVSLWISNEEQTYRFAMDCINRPHEKTGKKVSIERATSRFMESFKGVKTPDGAVYNRVSVKEALKGLAE